MQQSLSAPRTELTASHPPTPATRCVGVCACVCVCVWVCVCVSLGKKSRSCTMRSIMSPRGRDVASSCDCSRPRTRTREPTRMALITSSTRSPSEPASVCRPISIESF